MIAHRHRVARHAAAVLFSVCCATGLMPAHAGPIADLLRERAQQRGAENGEDLSDLGGAGGNAMSCADWSKRVKRAEARNVGPTPDIPDLAYGDAPLQRLDVFRAQGPSAAGGAPVIVMVHGGGWCVGDKRAASVTQNKVAHWSPKGFVFVTVNYPMVGEGSDAIAQAHHVARAVAYVQTHAREWGGDPAKLILMGHSAGAHLVSLVNADAQIRAAEGVRPVLGTISLDAGAIDVVVQMPHVYPFLKARYREAFGDNEAGWIAASPFHQLDRSAAPWLGVCSTKRKDDPCSQARAYADQSNALGIHAAVLPQPKNHGAINKDLGTSGDYTRDVEAFMATLDPVVAQLLKR
jgi:arylformamidase